MFPFIIQNTADDQPKNSKNSAHSVSETIPTNLNLYPQLVQVPEIPVAGMVAKLLRGSTINPPFQQRRDQDRKRLFADSNTSLFRYLLFFFCPL
ncbi:hypothetical protein CEXT_429731 [Caerostris extrusa]|uniref:Uncharacterized protein n=1 Tax=Caerostris extrusa TaxID=172846 RepID=A0AAV4PWJ9_CAEEX|nr:hypothetical protein CEXT_429731 [Caerostris extrusa]